MEQKTIILDITDCKDLNDLHKRIKSTFNFPDFYGKNWSAFWDLLWSECDADKVIVKGVYSLPSEFDKPLSIMYEILDRNKMECANSDYPFDYEIIS